MSLTGVYFDSRLVDAQAIARLDRDHIDKHPPPDTIRMMKPLPESEAWLTVDETYPDQMRERYRLVQTRKNYVIDRLPGADVTAAEEELRDKVMGALLESYPDFFSKKGDVMQCHLTGLAVDLKKTNPMVAIGLMASEDMVMLLPAREKKSQGGSMYRLKSGILMFPSGWCLRSHFNQTAPRKGSKHRDQWEQNKYDSEESAMLGKTAWEIHSGGVTHYMENFAEKTERAFKGLPANRFFWRRNWAPKMSDRLCLNPDIPYNDDTPPMTSENWMMLGNLRLEHQTFVKLPESNAVVFGIKTYLWKMSDYVQHREALDALIRAHDALPPAMREYRQHTLPSFGRFLEKYRAAPLKTHKL